MKQPTKEQLNDPKWWDKNAPEGATHIDEHGTFYKKLWLKMYSYTQISDQFVWCETMPIHLSHLIEWPKSKKEWRGMQDGLPPVGTECECYVADDGWFHAKVIGYDGPACVAAVDGVGYYGARNVKFFRPIQSSERDNFAVEVVENFAHEEAYYRELSMISEVARKMYDAGYRKQMRQAEANDVLMNRPFYMPAPERRALLDKLGFKE